MIRRNIAFPECSPALLKPGSLLNERYRIVGTRSANMYYTYEAQDTYQPGNVPCLVKHLHAATASSNWERLRQGFQSEARALMACKNPQLPQLLAFFQQDDNCFLVQENILGEPVFAEVKQGHCWTGYQVIRFLQEVLPLIELLHQKGIIHGYLTPDALVRRGDGHLALRGVGQIEFQTPPQSASCYLPPEQSRGTVWPSSNLYGVGMICIHALTGLAPSALEHDSDTGNICWAARKSLSSDLVEMINRLSLYYFKERFQSVQEVLDALEPLATVPLQINSSLSSTSSTAQPLNVSLPLNTDIQVEPDNVPVELFPSEEIGQRRRHNPTVARAGKAAIASLSVGLLTSFSIQNLKVPTPAQSESDPAPDVAHSPSNSVQGVEHSTVRTPSLSKPSLPVPRAQQALAPITRPAPVTPLTVTPMRPDTGFLSTNDTIVPSHHAQPQVSMLPSANTDAVESNTSVEIATANNSEAEAPEITTAMDSMSHHTSTSSVEFDPFYRRIMDILRGSPDVVIARLKQLASIYEQQGNYEAATFFYEKVIENQKLLYGEEHPEIVLSLIQLGNLHRESGQVEKAMAVSESTLAMWRSLYTTDHPGLSASLSSLEALQDTLSILEFAAGMESVTPDPMPLESSEPQLLNRPTVEISGMEEIDSAEQIDLIVIDSSGQIDRVEQTDSREQINYLTETDQIVFSPSEDSLSFQRMVKEADLEALNESY